MDTVLWCFVIYIELNHGILPHIKPFYCTIEQKSHITEIPLRVWNIKKRWFRHCGGMVHLLLLFRVYIFLSVQYCDSTITTTFYISLYFPKLTFLGCTTSWLVNPLPVVLTTCNIGLLIFSLSIFYSVDMDVIQRERGSNENKIKTYMYTVYNKQFSHWGIQHRNLVKWVLKR